MSFESAAVRIPAAVAMKTKQRKRMPNSNRGRARGYRIFDERPSAAGERRYGTKATGSERHSNLNAFTPELTMTTYCFPFLAHIRHRIRVTARVEPGFPHYLAAL